MACNDCKHCEEIKGSENQGMCTLKQESDQVDLRDLCRGWEKRNVIQSSQINPKVKKNTYF